MTKLSRIFEVTEEQDMLRGMVAEFAESELIPRREETITLEEFSPKHYWEIRELFGSLGFLALGIPEKYGGSDDFDNVLGIALAEEVAAVDLGFSHQFVSNSLVAPTILHYGTEEQKKRWLPGLASGKLFGGYCQTEPDTGSDVASIKCWAEQTDGNKFIITGTTTKIFVSMGAVDKKTPADVLLVMAKTSRNAKPHQSLTMLLVDAKTAFEKGQLEVSNFERKVGAHQTATVEFAFSNCEAEAVGKVNTGFKVAMNALTASRVGVAIQASGIAKGAYRVAYPYTTEKRTQFGVPIAELSAPAQYLHEMRAKVLITDLLSRRAAVVKDEYTHYASENIVYEASTAKRVNAVLATEIASGAVQLLGGHGYILENVAAPIWASARLMRIYEGTDEIQERLIFGDVLKRGGKYLAKLLLLKKGIGSELLYNKERRKVAEKWPFYKFDGDNLQSYGEYYKEILKLREMQLDNWVDSLPMPRELKGVRRLVGSRKEISRLLTGALKDIGRSMYIPYAVHANAYSHAFLDGAAMVAQGLHFGYAAGDGTKKIEVTARDVKEALRIAKNNIDTARSHI